jgi:hypothetical protein
MDDHAPRRSQDRRGEAKFAERKTCDLTKCRGRESRMVEFLGEGVSPEGGDTLGLVAANPNGNA